MGRCAAGRAEALTICSFRLRVPKVPGGPTAINERNAWTLTLGATIEGLPDRRLRGVLNQAVAVLCAKRHTDASTSRFGSRSRVRIKLRPMV